MVAMDIPAGGGRACWWAAARMRRRLHTVNIAPRVNIVVVAAWAALAGTRVGGQSGRG